MAALRSSTSSEGVNKADALPLYSRGYSTISNLASKKGTNRSSKHDAKLGVTRIIGFLPMYGPSLLDTQVSPGISKTDEGKDQAISPPSEHTSGAARDGYGGKRWRLLCWGKKMLPSSSRYANTGPWTLKQATPTNLPGRSEKPSPPHLPSADVLNPLPLMNVRLSSVGAGRMLRNAGDALP